MCLGGHGASAFVGMDRRCPGGRPRGLISSDRPALVQTDSPRQPASASFSLPRISKSMRRVRRYKVTRNVHDIRNNGKNRR